MSIAARAGLWYDLAVMNVRRSRLDVELALGLGLISLILYVRTAAPSVVALFDDTLEFQLVLPTLGIAHPTGYPLYTLLGYLFTRLPLGEMAYRVNLFSAIMGAAAMGTSYMAARELTGRRLAAALTTVHIATIPAWWSQTTIAEVYALHGFIQMSLLWLMLRWVHGKGALWPAGLALGLGLAHHRMILLLLPAMLVWLASRLVEQRHRRIQWIRALAAAGTPLLLYAYLPLRGRVTTSLDGTYHNTWAGFWAWVTARGYSVFLTGNPFHVERNPHFYLALIERQLGWWGIALALLGMGALLAGRGNRRRARWDGLALIAALATTYGFGLAYRVADVEVFFIPAFLCTGLAVAEGLAALQTGWEHLAQGRRWPASRLLGDIILGGGVIAALVFVTLPQFPAMDRHRQWDVHDLGEDILSQPMPRDSVIVGILGETTLVRYFQFAHGMRPDIQVIPADREADRLAAVDRVLARGEPVFLTRPLPGAERRYSLGAVGPLIRVWPKGASTWDPLPGQADLAMGDGVHMTGYLIELRRRRSGRLARLTVHWRAAGRIEERLKISARLATATNDKVAMADSEPVHNAYPTTSWLPGEVVQDVYDLRVPPSVPAGEYEVLLILYRAANGREIGRANLGVVKLPAP
ncbi:MAG: DUF2723 domain-containing protein [Anaerolineae bacterium]|nr:DUF2723 domain-containing protein [Anaerolineae bacterium]